MAMLPRVAGPIEFVPRGLGPLDHAQPRCPTNCSRADRGIIAAGNPWAWIYGMVLICIGLTSPCCLPVTIPLLIGWIKDDAKAYFGRN